MYVPSGSLFGVLFNMDDYDLHGAFYSMWYVWIVALGNCSTG
jgi:hypothetical protein